MIGSIGYRSVLILLSCLCPWVAQAAIINLSASLSGAEEVPPNGSSGTGSATVVFDDVTNILDWTITFSGLSGPATAAHFHGPAAPGVNASPQVNIGTISGLSDPMIGSAILSGAQAADLLAGLWYINIHTELYPGGEIRGQVETQVIPLPAAGWLLLSGLAGLFASRRSHPH